uniref:NGFI-A-binding protein 2-like n=1 Tax=Sinocyclocheilus rhinocerous TaxID=307959 RepID=A0A673H870_9TELE
IAAEMSLPRTLGELQLYRVLQRANLLMYYDTFIQQGGDDVQQLCEAGEEEFLEIMALVGMATKPLHVRRLQKALRDWAANPTLFNQPLATNVATCGIPLLRIDSSSAAGSGVIGGRKSLSNGQPGSPCEREEVGSCLTPLRDNSPKSPCSQASPVPPDHLYREKLSPMDPHGLSPEMYGAAELDEEQAITLLPFASAEESVDRLLRTMPQADQTEVKTLLRLNKKMAKTVGHIFHLEPQDKSKEEEIRKYSLIYGRFDSKWREGKQLTHHEMLINEAAAQFCIRDNAMLLRRVELFSLARQVARECAYTSTFKHNRSGTTFILILKLFQILHPDEVVTFYHNALANPDETWCVSSAPCPYVHVERPLQNYQLCLLTIRLKGYNQKYKCKFELLAV